MCQALYWMFYILSPPHLHSYFHFSDGKTESQVMQQCQNYAADDVVGTRLCSDSGNSKLEHEMEL